MNARLFLALRIILTLSLVALSILAAAFIWRRFERDPWTRDGHIRADILRVSPDVAGLITLVAVHDNQQVRPGDLLFVVDRPRFTLAREQADAAVASARATLAQSMREAKRDTVLGDLVATESHEQNMARIQTAKAALDQALSARDEASLNLQRTAVRATVAGTVTNLDLHPGDYIAVGMQAMAIVDRGSIRVEGYFEETKLGRIRLGDRVRVHLMGEPRDLFGHVESISAAISDTESTDTSNLLRDVNPTFTWVRLAQRIPVRVRLDQIPAGVDLIAGRTATVSVLSGVRP